MNIICVAACTAGVAHTYIVREKLIEGVETLDHTTKAETQGTVSIGNELQVANTSAADIVTLVVDVKIKGGECSINKRTARVRTETVIKSPIQPLEKIEKSLGNK